MLYFNVCITKKLLISQSTNTLYTHRGFKLLWIIRPLLRFRLRGAIKGNTRSHSNLLINNNGKWMHFVSPYQTQQTKVLGATGQVQSHKKKIQVLPTYYFTLWDKEKIWSHRIIWNDHNIFIIANCGQQVKVIYWLAVIMRLDVFFRTEFRKRSV